MALGFFYCAKMDKLKFTDWSKVNGMFVCGKFLIFRQRMMITYHSQHGTPCSGSVHLVCLSVCRSDPGWQKNDLVGAVVFTRWLLKYWTNWNRQTSRQAARWPGLSIESGWCCVRSAKDPCFEIWYNISSFVFDFLICLVDCVISLVKFVLCNLHLVICIQTLYKNDM